MIVMLQKFQLIPIKTECARAVPVGYLPLAEHAKERTFLRGGSLFQIQFILFGTNQLHIWKHQWNPRSTRLSLDTAHTQICQVYTFKIKFEIKKRGNVRNVFFKSGNLRIVAPLKRFWLLVASERQITLYWTKSVEIFRIFQLLLLTKSADIFRNFPTDIGTASGGKSWCGPDGRLSMYLFCEDEVPLRCPRCTQKVRTNFGAAKFWETLGTSRVPWRCPWGAPDVPKRCPFNLDLGEDLPIRGLPKSPGRDSQVSQLCAATGDSGIFQLLPLTKSAEIFGNFQIDSGIFQLLLLTKSAEIFGNFQIDSGLFQLLLLTKYVEIFGLNPEFSKDSLLLTKTVRWVGCAAVFRRNVPIVSPCKTLNKPKVEPRREFSETIQGGVQFFLWFFILFKLKKCQIPTFLAKCYNECTQS